MKRRAHLSLSILVAGAAMIGVLAACGTSTVSQGAIVHTGLATVSGKINQTYANLAALVLGAAPARAPTGPAPDSAVVGSPREDGSVLSIYKRAVTSPSTFSVDSVPAGYNQLMVVINDRARQEIGRTLVYSASTPDAQIRTQPIDGESTLEGGIYEGVTLTNHTIPAGLINPPTIGLVTRFDENTAASAATDINQLTALVDAYKKAQESFTRGWRALDPPFSDSLALNNDLRPVGQAYADALDGGADAQASQEDFIDGALGAYLDHLGGDAIALSTLWGTWATVHDAVLAQEGVPDMLRLESAQNLLDISIQAREKLVGSLADSQAKTTLLTDLGAIRDAGFGATSMSDFMSAVAAARQTAVSDLKAAVGSNIDAALSAADLGSFLDTSQDPPHIAASLPDYVSGVSSAAGDDNTAGLVVGAMGGPAYAGS